MHRSNLAHLFPSGFHLLHILLQYAINHNSAWIWCIRHLSIQSLCIYFRYPKRVFGTWVSSFLTFDSGSASIRYLTMGPGHLFFSLSVGSNLLVFLYRSLQIQCHRAHHVTGPTGPTWASLFHPEELKAGEKRRAGRQLNAHKTRYPGCELRLSK